MVKIRYAELPAGLHVATEAADRCTIVYLKPGLTRDQRKDALMVARRSARFGHGPSLPPLDMAFALAADRTRTTTRMAAWAIRQHPLLLLPLVLLIIGIVAASVMAAASVISVPTVSSAPSSGLHHVNIAQVVVPSVSARHRPSGSAPRSAVPRLVAGGQAQPAPHGGARHGAPVARSHPVAGTAKAAATTRGRGGGSSPGHVEAVLVRHLEVHGASGSRQHGHAHGAAAAARGVTC